ncbi:CDP-alcohol phosphatidyltransferase family protein [Tundrisphaera sp. TA3]|uniref:CDP-alcohol phosphatidyltransferase family protein n=1 Tax=Tundrisphaera sp. TA3 TaxID=3435775 RepID=UPI003EBD60C6
MGRLAKKKKAPHRDGAATGVTVAPRPTLAAVIIAWSVHLFTGMGLVVAAAMAVLLVRGGAPAFRGVFFLMVVGTLIDAIDGTFARRAHVKTVLPNFDGRKLDDITDFLTYTFLPLLLIWRAQLLPPGTEGWLLLPLLASAYGFCQVEAKTDDGYFLGFPSLWNVVALYLYYLDLPASAALAIVIVLALMTFIPSRYLYPTQPGRFNAFSNVIGAVWTVMVAYVIWRDPASPEGLDSDTRQLATISLFHPAFYMISSWIITLWHWFGRGPARPVERPSHV